MIPIKRAAVLLFFLLSMLPLDARRQEVHEVDVELTVLDEGAVVVKETWSVQTGNDISEWYLVRQNLGDIGITSFQVFDESGRAFENVGEWDVDRSRSEKAGRCGIVHKRDGVELCWGVGEYGERRYTAIYGMTSAVKSLQDYDMVFLQVVSPGLSSPPEHVKVTVLSKSYQLDTTNTRFWGFGFEGVSAFRDGKVVLESSGPLGKEDSAIVLLRFNKGMFASSSVQDRSFESVAQEALRGASFADDTPGVEEGKEDSYANGIAMFFTLVAMYFIFLRPLLRSFRKPKPVSPQKLLGFDPAQAPWYRDIPLGGDLDAADRLLELVDPDRKKDKLVMARLLRMIQQGNLNVSRDLEGPVRITFTPKGDNGLDGPGKRLYELFVLASGDDKVLQDKEFSSWAKSHAEVLYHWADSAASDGTRVLNDKGCLLRGELTSEGRTEAEHLYGLRNYLSDFTLSAEREAVEVRRWKDYLVYAALTGIAKKVASQLKDIDPSLFRKVFQFDPESLDDVLDVGDSVSMAVRMAVIERSRHDHDDSSGSSYSSDSGSRGGYGGSTSHGGGSGYSGGGRGGGGR